MLVWSWASSKRHERLPRRYSILYCVSLPCHWICDYLIGWKGIVDSISRCLTMSAPFSFFSLLRFSFSLSLPLSLHLVSSVYSFMFHHDQVFTSVLGPSYFHVASYFASLNLKYFDLCFEIRLYSRL
jgi:hypothetical protein